REGGEAPAPAPKAAAPAGPETPETTEKEDVRRDGGQTSLAVESDEEAGDALLSDRVRRFSSPLGPHIPAQEGGERQGGKGPGPRRRGDQAGLPLFPGPGQPGARGGSGRQARSAPGPGRCCRRPGTAPDRRLLRPRLRRRGERRDRADVEDPPDHGGAHGLL